MAIYILMALRSMASAFHGPSMQASMPLLAPQSELMRIASVNQMIQGVSSIAGPALGGALLVLLPISQILFLDVLGAAIAISFSKRRKTKIAKWCEASSDRNGRLMACAS